MKVILYIPDEGRTELSLAGKIEVGELGTEVVVASNLARLEDEWAADFGEALLVLCPADFEELLAIRDFSSAFLSGPLVLILPHHTREYLDAAYGLRPRFVFHWDDDFHQINSILSRMLRVEKQKAA